ncbi:helix-turn-helix transcriptional regulator [Streptomyces sp. I6]|uniref:helix-turn-helix domain-containing protein n=1 Tax=Streptomyces sp. I6 TaxID=2483113 RepID=UPI000F45A49E|nr:helix-turn-helix transcriptional regulator [Streptomyces sp. I6]RNL71695.1 XRE family transcriptional regulator [Streptomyces sp. I6]
MPGPKDLDPSASPRALLGAELRHARENAGLSRRELGEPLFVSASFIGQLEAGKRRMQPDVARRIDEILGTNGFFERNCLAANKSRFPDHFAEAVEAEAVATAIREYAPVLIPGLLQTEAYARAVFRAYRPVAPEAVIDELVEARLERARLLDDPATPMLWTVLDEAVLRRRVGSAAVMAEALRRIGALARRNRVMVQVVPFSMGAHTAMGGSLKLMGFADAPPLAYTTGLETGRLDDDPSRVARYKLTYDLLAANALALPESLALVASMAEDYAREDQRPC